MRWAVALAGWLLAAGTAMAQQTTLEPSAALRCLTPAAAERGAPEFPFAAFKNHLNGRVKVRLRFTGPALPPAVTVLEQEGDPSFTDAVQAHVRSLRVPCHDGGAQPAELEFDFLFRPDEPVPVPVAVPVDADQAVREQQLRCMAQQGSASMPDYPREALRLGVQGRVIVQMRFEAPDQPPVVRILPRVGGDAAAQTPHASRVFVQPLRDWAAGYRMPCLQGGPVAVSQVYVYRFEGESFGFKPGLGLRELLPIVRNIRLQRLQFDFHAMGCPFDLALHYRQPNLPNTVRELGSRHPARAPFLDWLKQSQLDLPDKSLDAVYGDELKFTVPCLKIDLNPSGVTS